MMFRPYIFALSTLFLGMSSASAATDWTKAQNEFRTAIGVNQTNNFYNTVDTSESAQHLQLGLQYDWLSLYEGFGLYLPAKITSRRYREQSGLNDQDYLIAPELKLFMAEAADLTFESRFQRHQLIAGIGSAEFLDPVTQAAARNQQKRIALALQLGRQPDRQNLALRLGTERNRLQSHANASAVQDNQLINQLDSDFLQLDYGHRISENTSILANAELRQEQQLQVDSDLQQVGAGFMQQWSGSQQLRVLGGYFQRDSLGVKNSGSFWQVENLWQLSDAWKLLLSSHRLSVLSYATNSVTQLDTTYQAQLNYLFSSSHQLKFALGRRSSRLDAQLLQRKRQEFTFGWDWQLNQHWQSQFSLAHFRQQDNADANTNNDAERNRNEIFWQLSWLW
ncbi:hypothetical protein EOE67_10370 [Rheinheimera riviphila]|uniref:Uncharacterized protein n=1 Tax=Rheinheimera riviphila TaxID=1834037 RepID=A0A437QS48_9GAMM|nr:hypothetical protein [Rheinheimera riviphila]RVU37289.1 hypothetical protein EOE67_10370 [Rheinheimera riviphila]